MQTWVSHSRIRKDKGSELQRVKSGAFIGSHSGSVLCDLLNLFRQLSPLHESHSGSPHSGQLLGKRSWQSFCWLRSGSSPNPRPSFSLVVRALESTIKVGSPVEVEVKATNLTNHDLMIGPVGTIYTYDVRHDGTLVAETGLAKKLKQPPSPCKAAHMCVETVNYVPTLEPLPPHQTRTEAVRVSDYAT